MLTNSKMPPISFLKADGAHDVHKQPDFSGEPLIHPLRKSFELQDPMPLLEYQSVSIEGKGRYTRKSTLTIGTLLH